MADIIPPQYNLHYDPSDNNLKEIARMADIDRAFEVLFAADADPSSEDYKKYQELLRVREIEALKIKTDTGAVERYKAGGVIETPWGFNGVDSFSAREENGVEDVCIKTLIVNPHRQLSLQKHRGREEIWEVQEGILTVNLNDKIYRISAAGAFDITDENDLVNGAGATVKLDDKFFGKSEEGKTYIYLPKGSVHAMNNVHDVPVKVKETQRGITYEADNDRLIEALEDKPGPRATIPLISDMEVTAAENFRRIDASNTPYWDNGLRHAQKNVQESSEKTTSAA